MRLILLIGGAAALAWQIVWSHHLGIALGASARAVALTVATAMAGMAVGSLVCARLLRAIRPGQPILLYGALELAIGLLAQLPALAAPWILSADTAIHRQWPEWATPFQVLALAGSIGPACLAMGATLPVMGLLARHAGSPLSRLYALNTAGAATGTLATAFLLLPSLGLHGTATTLFLAHAALALACGLLFLKFRRRPPAIGETTRSDAATPSASGLGSSPRPEILVLVTGSAAFLLEVAWFRSLKSAWFSTADSLAVMLSCFLVALAAGAALVPALRSRSFPLWAALAGAAFLVLMATPLIERFDTVSLFQQSGFTRQVSRFLGALLVMGPPVTLLGIVLPAVLDEARHPRRWAVLYALNTGGAVIGANLAAWLLLERIGPSGTAELAAILLAGAAFAGLSSWKGRGLLALLFLPVWIVTHHLDAARHHRVPGAERSIGTPVEVIARRHGPDATVSVVGFEGGRALFINGFFTTGEVNDPRSRYLDSIGRVPMLLHPDPRDALVICFGTGQTAHAVREESTGRVHVVDLNAAVFDLAVHFAANHDVLGDPRVSRFVMDGRTWLRRTEHRYEVITLEPMPPFFSGSNSLYSREFYGLARDRLAPGGLIAQWFPLHLMSPRQAASIAATFLAIFPDAILWFDPESLSRSGLPNQGILVGRNPVSGENGSPSFWEQWPGFQRSLPSGSRPLTEALARRQVALDPTALRRFAGDAPLVNDDNLLLEYGISPFRSRQRVEEMIGEIHLQLAASRTPPAP